MNRTPAMYEDVKKILDSAIASGGGIVTLPTPGQAVRWRQRAYEFRKLMRAKSDWSVYDRLVMRKLEPESCDVEIAVIEQPAVFTAAVGRAPIESNAKPPKAAKTKFDGLEAAAELFAKSLDEDIV